MTALWKNSPYLPGGDASMRTAPWSRCYPDHALLRRQFKGSHQYGITCTALSAHARAGWDDFTAVSQWVDEAEYAENDYVCSPGRSAKGHTRSAPSAAP